MTLNKEKSKHLPVIGWREWVSLKDLGISKIKAKVDSGARTSSLHAYDLEYFDRDDKRMVRFKVHPMQRSQKEVVVAEAEVLEFRSVRSSSGKAAMRPVIVSTVGILGRSLSVELTLANRDEMGFRMLLGREAIRGVFLVDTGNSYYNGVPKRKKKKEKIREPKPDSTK